MSNDMRDLVMGEAELGSSEDDESFDEEGGEARQRPRKGRRDAEMDDSSEEDDDDEDEEEARKIREGFIVDEDEDEDEEDEDEDPEEARKRRKRKRRQEREEEKELDEEDLDLIGENVGGWENKKQEASKYKRLKRGHREAENRKPERRGLDDIFDDEEEDEGVDERAQHGRPSHHRVDDDMGDFIEEDYSADEDERQRAMEDLEVARPRDKGIAAIVDPSGLDPEVLEDMEAIFGNGEDYGWALQIEEDEQVEKDQKTTMELKDVFEPSQLVEKMMTAEDDIIRSTDEPERFQLDRRPFKKDDAIDFDQGDYLKEEAKWITDLIWPKKNLSSDLQQPFQKAVGKVLEYFVLESLEVPYVFQHRKDYLIHARRSRNPDRRDDPEANEYTIIAEKLLNQDDLWRILELDIKFRSFIEKRRAIEKNIDKLKGVVDSRDDVLEDMTYAAMTMEELQDLQDYMNFHYTAQLRDIAVSNGHVRATKRPGAKSIMFDRVRTSQVYRLVKAYGISPDRVARNALREGKQNAEDDDRSPTELADSLVDMDFPTAEQVLYNARHMYAEELFLNPRMRKHFRMAYYIYGEFSCHRTEKGLRRIDESHPYYEIKYLRRQTLRDLALRPDLFLKMMKAEEDGLMDVRLELPNEREFRRELLTDFKSDNMSDLADEWNKERHKVLDIAFAKLERIVTKGVKDAFKTGCQEEILKICREEYSKRLDQAPYKPKGMELGTTPRVLVLSNGMGDPNRDPVFWAWIEEDGRAAEQGTLMNLARDDAQRDRFCEIVERRRPDVVGVSGWCADAHRLVRDIETIIQERGLTGAEYEENGEYRNDLLEVLVVNDEVARLYKDSPRALREHPGFASGTRYCAALGRYVQNPLKEYAALGKDVVSLRFHPCQNLVPGDKLLKQLDTSMVDMVNLCGVDINEAVVDAYTANLLPYVAGLGPRKATSVIKTINLNGGVVGSRDELVGDPDNNKLPVVGPRVWNNCASFLSIDYEPTNQSSEPLDSTRVHPEDYELGRKMAADALELDEEDVKAETDENGPGAIVRKLFKEEEQDKVNELILEEYAEQLERNYSQRKRATLETIRAELIDPYEELRRAFGSMGTDQVFLMFTGETEDSLAEKMTVSVNVRVVKDDFAICKLDCGIEGRVDASEVTHRSNVSIKEVIHIGQTVQAKIIDLNRKDFIAKLSLREDALRRPYRKHLDYDRDSWDYRLEDDDKEALREKDKVTGRTQRVVKHPNFRPFNATEAEQYLGNLPDGELVIRPSSKGNDHLAVTWKVANGIFQHMDVLELQKENEFSLGKLLRVGKHTYSDLDELIAEHVNGMSKKVQEMMGSDKYKNMSEKELERWLNSYSEANPNRSVYYFCLEPKHPGYFILCFKANPKATVGKWYVKVIPNAFEMLKSQYPDMRALTNGFKLRMQAELSKHQRQGGR